MAMKYTQNEPRRGNQVPVQSIQILKQSASKQAFQICQARKRCIKHTQFPLQTSLE